MLMTSAVEERSLSMMSCLKVKQLPSKDKVTIEVSPTKFLDTSSLLNNGL